MLLTETTAALGDKSGGTMLYWLFIGAMFILMLWMFSRSGKKRAAQMENQREKLLNSMTAGTWVRTTSGFFGKVVEVSGEVITLENLTGEETLWDLRAIAEVRDPDFGEEKEPADLSDETLKSPVGDENNVLEESDESVSAQPEKENETGETEKP